MCNIKISWASEGSDMSRNASLDLTRITALTTLQIVGAYAKYTLMFNRVGPTTYAHYYSLNYRRQELVLPRCLGYRNLECRERLRSAVYTQSST